MCDAAPSDGLSEPEDEPEHSDSSSSSDGEPPEDPLPAPKPESKVAVLKRKLADAQFSLDEASGEMKDGTYLDLSNAMMGIDKEMDAAIREIKIEALADVAMCNPHSVNSHLTEDFDYLDKDLVQRILQKGKEQGQQWHDDLIDTYGAILTEGDIDDWCPFVRMEKTWKFLSLLDFKAQKRLTKAFGCSCILCPFIDEVPARDVEAFTWDVLVHAPQLVVNVMACSCRPRPKANCTCWIKFAARDGASEEHWADPDFVAAVGGRGVKLCVGEKS